MDSDDQVPQHKRQRRTSPSPTPHDDACDALSPPSNAEQASSPLLSLTVELFTEITSYLDDVDFHNLITTCAVLYSHLYLDDVIRRFSAGAGIESVFCLEGARKDEIGWKPFTIIDARYGNASEWGGSDDAGEVDPPKFVVFIYLEHDFEEVQHRPTRDYLVLYVEDEAVWVDWTSSPKWLAEHLDERQLAQWEDVHGRMVLATPEMIKQRFTCPECDGSGEVLYGFLLTAMNWPLLPSSDWERWEPCPRCSISYEEAIRIHEQHDQMFNVLHPESPELDPEGEPIRQMFRALFGDTY